MLGEIPELDLEWDASVTGHRGRVVPIEKRVVYGEKSRSERPVDV